MLRLRRAEYLVQQGLASGELVNGNRWRAVTYAEGVSKYAGGVRGVLPSFFGNPHQRGQRITWAHYRQKTGWIDNL
jgi:hypothetical protein